MQAIWSEGVVAGCPVCGRRLAVVGQGDQVARHASFFDADGNRSGSHLIVKGRGGKDRCPGSGQRGVA
jgi:hypothetical protein